MTYLEKESYKILADRFNSWFSKNTHLVFWGLIASTAIIMLLIYNDYGVTNDEAIHQAHGEVLYDFYSGQSRIAALSPIDSTGNLYKTFVAVKDENFRGMNFFGGLFDLTVNTLHKLSPDTNIYQFRHLINLFFGLLIFIFTGLAAKELVNWKTGILAALFIILSPRVFGHSFANPKDIPFAAMYVLMTYLLIRFYKTLPKIKPVNAFLIIIIIGLSINIRVSGILFIPYFFLMLGLWWSKFYIENKTIPVKSLTSHLIIASAISLFGYLSTTLLWPYASTDWLAPIKVLIEVANFEVFNAYEIFNGSWYVAKEIPWTYVPVWIWISIPLFLNAGILLIIWLLASKYRKNTDIFLLSAILFFFAFPPLFTVIKGSNIYNGIRHLMFIFPILAVLSAVAWQYFIKYTKHTAFQYITVGFLIITLAQPLVWSIKAHPYQTMYFSPLVGGPIAVSARYETDYWGFSTKEAVAWIAAQTEERRKNEPVYIKMFYGDPIKVTAYLDNYPNLYYQQGDHDAGWDYEIKYFAAAKFDHNLRHQWPPKSAVNIIEANGIPLSAIIANPFAGLTSIEVAEKFPTFRNYLNLSLELYYANDFVGSFKAAKKAHYLDPLSPTALNNVGSAANALGLFSVAEVYLTRSLELDSTWNLTKNNLKVSIDGKSIERTETELINLSLAAYQIEEYQAAIELIQEALSLNPKNAVAWNNLCSYYNAVQQYVEAEKACLKAIKLSPDFQLAKNNLAYTRSMLQK